MDPMQQTPQSNPYDFITNPGPPEKKPFLGGSTTSRLIIVVGGILLLLIIFGVANTILSSGKNASTLLFKNIVAEQEELIRVADLGTKDAMGTQARSYAVTTSLTVRSNQQEITELLTASKIEITPTELSSKSSKKTDDALAAAKANNRYDEELTSILNKNLEKYMSDLKTAHDSASTEKSKAALNKAYNNASTLLKVTTKTE